MTGEQLYKEALNFLQSCEYEPGKNITIEDIKAHYNSEYDKPKSLASIYTRLCSSAYNKHSSPKVIGRQIKDSGGLDEFGKQLLFRFNPHEVAKKYEKTQVDATKFLKEIKKYLSLKNINEEPNGLWHKYCKSVIYAAHFLKQFDSHTDFYNWADFFAKDDRAKPALPMILSMAIFGFGFALACDFLKEIGYNQFGKPDVHLKDILQELKFVDSRSDYATFKAIDRIAEEVGITSYKLDKILWLIGSGNFYKIDKKIKPPKDNFIAEMKKKYNL